MTITKENIAGLRKLYAELRELTEKSSDAIKAAKEYKNNIVLIRRKGGKEVEVTEGALWEEVRYINSASEGYAVLKDKYPEAFALGEQQNAKAKELSEYSRKEIGLDPLAMRLIDIIDIVEAVIESKKQ